MYAVDELVAPVMAPGGATDAPTQDRFLREATEGLTANPKTIPCKYFYDARGSQLFEEICGLQEYYPTRTELSIMERHASDMAAVFQTGDLMVELGSGSSIKTRLLLDRLQHIAGYVPVDISASHLEATSASLRRSYPWLNIAPVAADYTTAFAVPLASGRRVVVYFPGSTIGNFHPDEAVHFMRQIRGLCGTGGGLLIGVDLRKDEQILDAAYDDEAGVTAAFNKNILTRLNRELDADFDVDGFAHRARWNASASRMEMHLESLAAQAVTVAGQRIEFREGETIHTENSYKFTHATILTLLNNSCFALDLTLQDDQHRFAVVLAKAI